MSIFYYIFAFYYLSKIKSLKSIILRINVVLQTLMIICLFLDFIIFTKKFIDFNIISKLSIINSVLWDIYHFLGLIFIFQFIKTLEEKRVRVFTVILMLLYLVAVLFMRLPRLLTDIIDPSSFILVLYFISFLLIALVSMCTLILLFVLKRKLDIASVSTLN